MPRLTGRRLAIAGVLGVFLLYLLLAAVRGEQVAEIENENGTDVDLRVEVRKHDSRTQTIVPERLGGGVTHFQGTYYFELPPGGTPNYHVRAYGADGVEVYHGLVVYRHADHDCRIVLVESPATDGPRTRAECVRPDSD